MPLIFLDLVIVGKTIYVPNPCSLGLILKLNAQFLLMGICCCSMIEREMPVVDIEDAGCGVRVAREWRD
jgi:hypothetical protein